MADYVITKADCIRKVELNIFTDRGITTASAVVRPDQVADPEIFIDLATGHASAAFAVSDTQGR